MAATINTGDTAAYERSLGESRDERTRRRRAKADEAVPLTDPMYAKAQYDNTTNRIREDAATGPGGWARPWALWSEALNRLGEETGKNIKVDPSGMGVPIGEAPAYAREQGQLPVDLEAMDRVAHNRPLAATTMNPMLSLPLGEPGMPAPTPKQYMAPYQSKFPASMKGLGEAAGAPQQSPVRAPVVQGPTVSGPKPLAERPLPPLQQPDQPRGATGGGGGTGSSGDYTANGRLKAIPKPWVPNLPSRNPLPPSASMMALQQLLTGSDRGSY